MSGTLSIPAGALRGRDFSKMTAAQLEALAKQQGRQPANAAQPARAKARMPRNGRTYETDAMNQTEERYAGYLDGLKHAGKVVAWAYEAVKLRLANRTFYTPDFLVVTADGGIEIHEVKGHWEDDARVKIKVAARMYPWFHFRAVKWVRGGWETEDF